MSHYTDSKYFRLLTFFGISIIIILPTYLLGVYNGPDTPQHYQFAETFRQSISIFDFYPSWGANENLGYGSVGLRFYPPLFSFSLGLSYILVKNWHLATCLIFLVFSFIGSYGSYLWAKEFLSASEAFWAGVVYALMPYHLNQIYNLSVNAEFAGSAFIPFCFLFILRICRSTELSQQNIAGLATSYGLLILTHLPTTVICSICFLIYGLLCLPKNNLLKTILKLSLASILALIASSPYWLRMIGELYWMRFTKFRNEIIFDYSQNFLLTSPWFDFRQYWFLNLVLIVTIIVILVSFFGIYLKKRKSLNYNLRGVIITTLICILMTVVISNPLWETFTFIQQVQFPFRWLTVVNTTTSVIFASGIFQVYKISQKCNYYQHFSKAFLALFIVGMVSVFCVTWISIRNNYISAANFEQWVNDKKNSMGFDFFWTVKTDEKVFDVSEKIRINERSLSILNWSSTNREFFIGNGLPQEVRIATLYYPHWRASVNNVAVEVKPSEEGAILIPIPSEPSKIKLWFQEPLYIEVGKYASGLAWITILLCLAFKFILKMPKLSVLPQL